MGEDTLRAILKRISDDPSYRTSVIYRPAKALLEYNLSPEESAAFKERRFDSLGLPEDLAEALRNRLDTSGI